MSLVDTSGSTRYAAKGEGVSAGMIAAESLCGSGDKLLSPAIVAPAAALFKISRRENCSFNVSSSIARSAIPVNSVQRTLSHSGILIRMHLLFRNFAGELAQHNENFVHRAVICKRDAGAVAKHFAVKAC